MREDTIHRTLTIEVVKRSTERGGRYEDSFLAIAAFGDSYDGAVVGTADGEQAAVMQAVQRLYAPAEPPPSFIAETPPRLTRRIAVSPDQIRDALNGAILRVSSVRISGRRADGTRYADREVYPRSIGPAAGLTTYLHCRDPHATGDQYRAFRLSGIDRVEWDDQ